MSLPNFENLTLHEEGSVLIATLNRPEAMNALNAQTMQSLAGLVEYLGGRAASSVRALIITGAGEKAFVAGADIREFEGLSIEKARNLATLGQEIMRNIEGLKIPVIAAVNGFALGGGLELALACDFIYASENAKFGLPECTLGLMPGYGGTVRLPRRVGLGRAREMTMTGQMISAAEALNMGLVNRVLASSDLLAAAIETAKAMTLRAPLALGKIKQSIRDGFDLDELNASNFEASLFAELFATDDKTEGVKAFIEKRKPNFQGH